MIVLLNCSMNLLANDNLHPSTGELVELEDSVQISYDDLRIVNSKLIELKYTKEINSKLKQVIANDSIVISDYKRINENLNKSCNKAIKQRNICLGIATITVLVAIFSFLK